MQPGNVLLNGFNIRRFARHGQLAMKTVKSTHDVLNYPVESRQLAMKTAPAKTVGD